jgi:hypothetical protein
LIEKRDKNQFGKEISDVIQESIQNMSTIYFISFKLVHKSRIIESNKNMFFIVKNVINMKIKCFLREMEEKETLMEYLFEIELKK